VAGRISGSRPGARRDNIENTLRRLQDWRPSQRFPGSEKSYAFKLAGNPRFCHSGNKLLIWKQGTGPEDAEKIET